MSSMTDRFTLAADMLYKDIRSSAALLSNFDRPRSYKAVYNFDTGQPENFLDNEFSTKRNCDFLCVDLSYTIRRPEFLKGQTFKASEDAAFLIVPYIDIFLEVSGCPQMSLTDHDQPLETVGRPICVPRVATMDPFPFLLPGLETLKARCTLTREFNADIGELPMDLTLVMWGYALTCKRYGLRTWEQCCDVVEQYPAFLLKHTGQEKLDRDLVKLSMEGPDPLGFDPLRLLGAK